MKSVALPDVTVTVPSDDTLAEYAPEEGAGIEPGFGATYGPVVLQLPQVGAPPPACAVTVNVVDPMIEPRVAWMVVLPAATAVARPVEALMVAADEFKDDQATEVVMG